MMTANEIFLETLAWLECHYDDFTFYVERDIVWTFQQHLVELIQIGQYPLQVYNDYPMVKLERRSLCAEIAIISTETMQTEVVAEFVSVL